MSAEKQKILTVSAPFGEHSIQTIDIPTPSPGQVLVKIYAAGLNPGDWLYQAYGFFKEAYPLTFGLDAAGEVVDVASDVTRFNKGDRVFFQAPMDEITVAPLNGTFRQYMAVPTNVVAKVPSSIPFEQAATLPVPLATVALSLYNQNHESASIRLTPPWEDSGRGKYTGKSFFVPGGASQVGLFALQFAKLSGFNPIIATASPHNFELVKSFGATHVIDRKLPSEQVIEQVAAIAGGAVDVIYDPVAKEDTQAISISVLRRGGQLVTAVPYSEDSSAKLAAEKNAKAIFARGGMAYGPNIGAIDGLLDKLPEYLESGLIKPTPIEILPGGLRGVEGGLQRLGKWEVSGVKLVVRPQDTE